jgi:tRNA (cmo5U34)-methyltransferase
MSHDNIFQRNTPRRSDFEFNTEVAEVFDDMLIRSVPFYMEQQSMIVEIGKKFWQPGTNIYDLGCSTAFTLINLCRAISGPASFIGFDNSPAMLERAKKNIESQGMASRIELHHGDLNGGLDLLPLTNASVVTLCWTLQFVRPLRRDELIQWIYQGLVGGGVLVVTEKVLTNSSPMNRFFIEFYYDFKAQNGYSGEEITRKREALENVLIPYRLDENLELFRRNGFEIVETFFQWYNFVGFLCVKKPEWRASS